MSRKMVRILRCLALAILLPVAITTSSCAVWAHEQDEPHQDDGVGVTFRAEGVFETIADGWQVQDIGFATKPSFDFDAAGRLHVMGMTEDRPGIVWYAVADSIEGPWNPEVVSTGYFYGPGDLRVDASGTAHLAWHNHDEEDSNHLTVSPQGDRNLFQIPTPGHNGWDNALALDSSGRLFQSSVNPSGFGATTSLEYGVFDGTAWTYQEVPNSGAFMYGLNTSVALDGADQPHIVYCQCDDWATPGDLRYAHQDAQQGWQITTVATGGIRGRFPALAIDDADRPHVAWIDIDSTDTTRGSVRYGVLEDGTWSIETIDTLEDIRLGFSGARKLVSLELDSQGQPHVAYGDEQVVKYATRTPANDWDTTTVLRSNQDPYNGLVVLRLSPQEEPAIVFWQPHDTQPGVVRIVSAAAGPALLAGDANQDLQFNQLDLFQVLRGGKYLTGQPATWGEGDWNGAPGGSPGNPPAGDGVFDNLDVVASLNADVWLTGPYASLGTGSDQEPGHDPISIGYDARTGEIWVDSPAGAGLTSVSIESTAGIFTAEPAENLGGSFDIDTDNHVFKATFGDSFGSLSFGKIARPGLAAELLLADLEVIGSRQGGGGLGDVDLTYVPVPEASTFALMTVGLLGLACRFGCTAS